MYYLYRHIRLDTNEVFYIGIGKKYKENFLSYTSEYCRAFKKTGRNKYWQNIKNLTNYEVEIIFETESKLEIIEKEKEFISLYGRKDLNKGTLVNFTDGGEGMSGHVPTQEHKNKISKSNKGKIGWSRGKKLSESHVKALSISHKGQQPYMKGKKHNADAKLKMSIAKLGKYRGEKNPSFGKKHSLESKMKMGTPVLQYDLDSNFIREFYSITEASIMTNSLSPLIQKVCKGERNKHNNFIWKYKDINNTRI